MSLSPESKRPKSSQSSKDELFENDAQAFRRGRLSPVAIVISTSIALGAAGLFALALRTEAEVVSPEQIARLRSDMAKSEPSEKLKKARLWAARTDVPAMQQEAFAELAWAKEKDGIALMIAGLSSSDHRVRGAAAQALIEYDAAARLAVPHLQPALRQAKSGDRPQIAWALVVMKDASSVDAIIEEYKLGHLARVERIDGRPAFDPELLAAMLPTEKLPALIASDSESVRQLAATALNARVSDGADSEAVSSLIRLVQDRSVDVAREAAVGLGKAGSERAVTPLLAALERSDRDSRARFIDALRDGVGAKGLILALKLAKNAPAERVKFQTKQIFDQLRDLADPRGADLLAQYIDVETSPHWKTEAAFRLAEIGDVRAIPTLAWRLTQDPVALYDKAVDPEYTQDDNERVVAARMIADLAILYPDLREEIRGLTERPALHWANDRPEPHANVMRVLAATHATSGLPKLREWANPKMPLPKEGDQVFSAKWGTAQSALRYLGWMQDGASWSLLERQLNRRPAKIDTTTEALSGGGLAVLGMTLRGLAVGASDGFAQWGDSKAFAVLTKFIDEPLNNEQARMQACAALSWVASDEQMQDVVKQVRALGRDAKSAARRSCYLETLIRRPAPSATQPLVDLLQADVEMDVRHQAARAIGMGGVTAEVSAALVQRLSDVNLRADVTLALLLGGDEEHATGALASYNDANPEALEELKSIYQSSFGYWSDRNYASGDLSRWVRNAEACRHVRVNGALQEWPSRLLSRALQGVEFDNGPHSLTRVQLRAWLTRAARSSDRQASAAAVELLKFIREKGVLMALRTERGHLGDSARAALFDVMNPKVVSEEAGEVGRATRTR